MNPKRIAPLAAVAAIAMTAPAESQVAAPARSLSYADLADLALPAPVVAHVRIAEAVRLKPERAPGVAPGHSRFFIEADVISLIRAPRGLPARVRFLADVPDRAPGKPARPAKRGEMLILGATVPGRPGELALTGPSSHFAYSAEGADRLRSLLAEAAAADAAPAIVGIGKAFHVPGAIPGEGETQIFLLTADQRPISLTVLRRPGEQPIWAVALSEIVDQAAAEPRRDTLLWYRLACTLPARLPRQSLADADPATIPAIERDYRLILDRLGPCNRTRAAQRG